MKLTLTWNSPVMEWDYLQCKEVISQPDKECIFLNVKIKGLSEKDSYKFFNDLEKAINKELKDTYGEFGFSNCTGYEDSEPNTLIDTGGWKRDFGNIAEQKREIIRTIRKIYKELKKQY